LEWSHDDDEYPATILLLLKAVLEKSVDLKRLVLIDGSGNLPNWSHPPEFADSLVTFAAKMSHMTCCCVTFNHLDVDLMKGIKERVEEEVVQVRPSLWFHLGRSIPEASDPGVPAIHYHQIVYPMSFLMPHL